MHDNEKIKITTNNRERTADIAPSNVKRHGFDTWATQSFWSAIVYRWFDKDGYELEGVVVGMTTWR